MSAGDHSTRRGAAVAEWPIGMMRHASAVLSALCLSGCIIGTWPTPEGRSAEEPGTDQQPIGEEICNELDDDGDGTVDEGCPCNEDVRGCIGHSDAWCGHGVQWCRFETWQSCEDLGPPLTPVRSASLNFSDISETSIVRGETQALVVSVAAQTVCDGVVLPLVTVTLEATQPEMRVRTDARDDGTGGDETAWDGLFGGTLPNVFGPGVPSQTLTLQTTARIDGEEVFATETIPLEAP